MSNIVTCDIISVDCVRNDPVDIRAGGPELCGFDFYVKKDKTEELKTYITLCLQKLNVPLMNISVTGEIPVEENKIWDESKILASIKREAEELIRIGKRNYPPHIPRGKKC